MREILDSQQTAVVPGGGAAIIRDSDDAVHTTNMKYKPNTNMKTFEEFAKTERPITEEVFKELCDEGGFNIPKEDCLEFDEGYVIHQAGGQWYVHAWWYAPKSYKAKDEAIKELYRWYGEFN